MKTLGLTPFLQPHNSTPFTPFSHSLFTSAPYKASSNTCSTSNILFSQGRRNEFFVVSAKKQKRGSKSLMELAAFDELDDDVDDEDGEEDEVFIPMSGMKEWFEKKPSGFGEGKEYDTSVEDKLLEELEQSRKAQLININNLKKSPVVSGSKKEVAKVATPEAVPIGVCVRVGNLPKKKNIRRDLLVVFKGFPAILTISPAVSGNRKTRDPICKGFAFVYLGSVEAANRFVQAYSKKSITFGKIEKQITCDIIDPAKSSDPASKHPSSNSNKSTPGQRLPLMDTDSIAESYVNDLPLGSVEVTPCDESVAQHEQLMSPTLEAIEEGIADITLSKTNDPENRKPPTSDTTDSSPLKRRPPKKKLAVKRTSDKSRKSSIPGSTKRLKVKEKAVLAGAFSKYGSKGSVASTKGR